MCPAFRKVLTCVLCSFRCSPTVFHDRIRLNQYVYACMLRTRVTSSIMARLPLRASTQQSCWPRIMASSCRSPRHHRRPWDCAIRPRLRGILTCRDPDISPPSQAFPRRTEPLGQINRFTLLLVRLE
jgi:hypothetical protein